MQRRVLRSFRDRPLPSYGCACPWRGKNHHGRRRRKNCALFVAGKVTDLLLPSSVTLAVFVTQVAGAASVPACSNLKLAVSADGQETVIPPCGMPERSTESVGRVSRYP